jgi:hypothetical protein
VTLFRRKPPFQLTGLVASPDGLYDGSFVLSCARWWNHEVQSRSEMFAEGYRPFSAEEVARLRATVQPENRGTFETVAATVALPTRYPAAVLCLAYALALVVDAGAMQVREPEEADIVYRQPRSFAAGDLVELQRHYSEEGAAHEYELWPPWWVAAPSAFGERLGAKVIASAKAAFDDQVDRWGQSEGSDLRQSIGPIDYAYLAVNENAGFLNFVELLFEWGARRLGERYLAEDIDLKDVRYSYDPDNYIDHLYNETLERYREIASRQDSFDKHIEFAAGCCAAWLGDRKGEHERLAISTTAIRAYLWRSVQQVNFDFMQPKLSEAIENSRTVGDDRGPDEPFGLTLYFAASQCMADGVQVRLGSIGGLLQGPRSYEKAYDDTTNDYEEQGIEIDEETKRLAFQFGICLADSEGLLRRASAEA